MSNSGQGGIAPGAGVGTRVGEHLGRRRFAFELPGRISLREEMPSFENTLRRCHSAWGLMNNWAQISGFVSPSPARQAICASYGVRAPCVGAVRLRTFAPVACSSRRARPANASAPTWLSISWAAAR